MLTFGVLNPGAIGAFGDNGKSAGAKGRTDNDGAIGKDSDFAMGFGVFGYGCIAMSINGLVRMQSCNSTSIELYDLVVSKKEEQSVGMELMLCSVLLYIFMHIVFSIFCKIGVYKGLFLFFHVIQLYFLRVHVINVCFQLGNHVIRQFR